MLLLFKYIRQLWYPLNTLLAYQEAEYPLTHCIAVVSSCENILGASFIRLQDPEADSLRFRYMQSIQAFLGIHYSQFSGCLLEMPALGLVLVCENIAILPRCHLRVTVKCFLDDF